MENILTQRFNYATIVPYRNYCRLDEKNTNQTTFNDDFDFLDEDSFELKKGLKMANQYAPSVGRIMTLPEKKGNRKTCFFYDNSSVQERFQLNYALKTQSHQFETTKDQQIKRHFGNPFSSISVCTIERSIRRHGDKITIKTYQQIKSRGFNSIYFKKKFSVRSLTFNTVTGNITTLSINNGNKVKQMSFRTNSFKAISRLISENGILDDGNTISKFSRVYQEYIESLNLNEFMRTVRIVLELPKDDTKTLNDLIIKKFVENKKIKVSNDYEYWITHFYPTEKYLKKNDRKLIASILDMFKIKSKITIKILHERSHVDIFSLAELCYFLGDNFSKYIGNVKPEIFDNKRIESDDYSSPYKFNFYIDRKCDFDISDVEKENIIKIVNSTMTPINKKFIGELRDHFTMIKKLRVYSPDLSMRARTQMEFHNEHLELSKMMSFIRKGSVIEYQFAEQMVKAVEEPITISIDMNDYEDQTKLFNEPKYEKITFYPYILKREEEYDEEGRTMHHCVASYSDKDRSIIVSIRTKDLSDRITCEFDCQTGKLIQARHFCNKQPPADMELALDKLKKVTEYYARIGLLHSLEKKKVPVKINGIEVIPEVKEPRRFVEPFFLNY